MVRVPVVAVVATSRVLTSRMLNVAKARFSSELSVSLVISGSGASVRSPFLVLTLGRRSIWTLGRSPRVIPHIVLGVSGARG